ncbi:MAG: hypothetical protein CMM58_06000 [Rhodospirillaceae bacterium]|nr:hypothetical protein [Rhodospirillaceae bacterium]
MILYQLLCDQEHQFEAWFKDSRTFDKQSKRNLLSCPECGSVKVSKALMAPRIGKSTDKVAPPSKRASLESEVKLTPEAHELREKLKDLRNHVEQNCDYVGNQFAEEARKIHYGEKDPKNIYGEASLNDAKELAEEGVEFTPIPWLPKENS